MTQYQKPQLHIGLSELRKLCLNLRSQRWSEKSRNIVKYFNAILLMEPCVCVYSSTFWFLLAAPRLWHTWDVRINDLLLWVLFGASAKFLHLHFQIIISHLQRRNSSLPKNWKQNDMIYCWIREKTIYIDIGYKTATC